MRDNELTEKSIIN